MEITFNFVRSREWTTARRIETGENVPEQDEVTVDPLSLSDATRAFLIDTYGEYRSMRGIPFNAMYELTRWGSYGVADLRIDAGVPTPEQIDAAILDALRRIAADGDKKKAEEAEREAEEARKAADEKRRADARELLANEFEQHQSKIAHLTDDRDQYDADRKVLAQLLRHVAMPAKEVGLRRLLDESPEGLDGLRARIEAASPVVYIFEGEGGAA